MNSPSLRRLARPAAARSLAAPAAGVWSYITGLLVCAIALGAGALPTLPSGTAGPELPWLVLVAAFALAELLQVHLYFRGEAHTFTLAEVPLVLGLVYAAPTDVLLAQICGATVTRLLWRRQSAVKQAFNLAVCALEAAIAIIVFRSVAPLPTVDAPRTWLAVGLAVLAMTLSSAVLVAGAIGISEGRSPLRLLTRTIGPAVVVTTVNTALAYAIVVVVDSSPLAAIALLAPVAVCWVGYRAYTRQVDEQERLEFLVALGRVLQAQGELERRIKDALALCQRHLRARQVVAAVLREHATDIPRTAGVLTAEGAIDTLARSAGENGELVDGSHVEPAVLAALAQLGVGQVLVTPLRIRDEVVGAVLALGRLGEISHYEAHYVQVLGAVADRITVALDRQGLADALAQLQDVQDELTHQARHDPLTGLGNRRHLTDAVTELLAADPAAHSVGGGLPALLLLDLDGFKAINDRHGHGVGDEILRVVAERLRRSLRERDLAARLGGDEFVVLLRVPLTAAKVQDLGERILSAVNGPCRIAGQSLDIRFSLGIARVSAGIRDADELLRRADLGMYEAKRRGDGRLRVYDEDASAAALAERLLSRELAAALADGAVRACYQPVFSLATGELIAVETLARWCHPQRGEVPAEEFVALAERTGQVNRLGRLMLREGCRQLAHWQRSHPRSCPAVSVNVSVSELTTPGYAESVEATLLDTGADPARLILEVTESQMISEAAAVASDLHRLRRRGVRVAIDDFGSGYASVNHLRRLPVDILKLDRTLVTGAVSSQSDAEIVRAILALAAALNLQVMAEGLETDAQVQLLRQLGCALGQGLRLGSPGVAAAIDEILLRVSSLREVDPEWLDTPVIRSNRQDGLVVLPEAAPSPAG